MTKLLMWKIYEVTSKNDLQGIKFRGRLRKWATLEEYNLLVENDEVNKNCVRYAVLDENFGATQINNEIIKDFIKDKIDQDANITFIGSVQNPVLSKLKVNNMDRYEI